MKTPTDPHLTPDALDAILGTASDSAALIPAEQHVATCSECALLVEQTRALYSALAGLPQEGTLPPNLREAMVAPRTATQIRPRLGGLVRGNPGWATTLRIAAAVSLFVAGAAVGAVAVRSRTVAPIATGADAVLRVQELGSAYVEAVAQLERTSRNTNIGERTLAQEVVLSTLSGAAQEAARLSGTPATQDLLEAARRARLGATSNTPAIPRTGRS